MLLISVSDVRRALREFSGIVSNSRIQRLIELKQEELRGIIKIEDLESVHRRDLLKKWILNKVCAEVLREHVRINKQIEEWIQIMEQSAEQALQMWFTQNVRYRAVAP